MGNNLLITTSFSFLRLNLDSGALYPLHRGDGLYYGIAKSSTKIYVAARRRLVSSEVSRTIESGRIIVFNKDMVQIETIYAPFPLRDMHELKWYNNMLWVTCSFDDMIAIYDGVVWTKWYPLGKPADDLNDLYHFNSLLFEDGYVWVIAHNRGPSMFLKFDINTFHLLDKFVLGNQAHNIWRQGDEILTCSSGSGEIIGSNGFKVFIGGFPRGVAFLNSRKYVAVSELAERKERDFTTGYLLEYNDNWTLINRLALVGEGLILDILPDYN